MAFGVRDSTANGSNTGTAITVTAPTGIAAGDIIVVVITINGQRTCADNNGGTPFAEVIQEDAGSDTGTLVVYHRRATGAEGSSFAFTSSGSDRWGIVCVAIQDAHPDDDFGTQWPIFYAHASATTILTQDHYGRDGELHFVAIAPDSSGNTITATPAGYTALENVTTNATISLSVLELSSDAYVGKQSHTITSGAITTTTTFTVKPPDAAAAASGVRYHPGMTGGMRG